jgi:hypothetical protein
MIVALGPCQEAGAYQNRTVAEGMNALPTGYSLGFRSVQRQSLTLSDNPGAELVLVR